MIEEVICDDVAAKFMTTIEHAHQVVLENRGLLQEIKQTIRRLLPEADIRLFGSAARGTRRPDSDYDILVLTDRPLTSREQEATWNAIFEIELQHETVISTVFCAVKEWNTPPVSGSPFRRRVEDEAVVL